MRIRVVSDLHLEFGPLEFPPAEADVLVLAGDIDVGLRGVAWVERLRPGMPVIYVPGNHEYYGHALPTLTDKLRQAGLAAGISVLDGDEVVVDGVRFLGATLWTDFALHGPASVAMAAAREAMTDYRRIRVVPEYRRLRPADTASRHGRTVRWLAARAEAGATAGAVVVTHHAPSARSLHPGMRDHPLGAAYGSNLDELVAHSGARLWIHGHTHRNVGYEIGSTRVLSNQRGYVDEPVPGFDAGLVVEV